MPTVCPACGSEVVRLPGEAALRCPNRASCPAQLVEGLRYFASREGMDIRGIGRVLAEKLIASGKIHRLSDIYTLTPEDWMTLDKIAEKSAENLTAQLEDSKRRPLVNLITALGIQDVGKNTAGLLVNHFGSMDAMMNASQEDLAAVDGIGEVIAKSVHEFFRNAENVRLIEDFRTLGFRMSEDVSENRGTLWGKSFVFTGGLASMTREEAGKRVKALGGKVITSVSSKTDYVVLGYKPGSKLKKAEELGITILTEADFLEMTAK